MANSSVYVSKGFWNAANEKTTRGIPRESLKHESMLFQMPTIPTIVFQKLQCISSKFHKNMLMHCACMMFMVNRTIYIVYVHCPSTSLFDFNTNGTAYDNATDMFPCGIYKMLMMPYQFY